MCFIIPIPTIYHSSFVTYHRICSQSNTMGVASGAEIVYPSGAPAFTPSFSGVHVTRSVVFCAVFCRSLFVRLSFFCLPLCCLSFFDLRILITSFISSTKLINKLVLIQLFECEIRILSKCGNDIYDKFFLALKYFQIIWPSYILALRVPDEGYSRNASCAVNQIPMFYL